MKTCPVCGAKSFKDMRVCFGCMHRFGEVEEAEFVPDEPKAESERPCLNAQALASVDAASNGRALVKEGVLPGVSPISLENPVSSDAGVPCTEEACTAVGEAEVLPARAGEHQAGERLSCPQATGLDESERGIAYGAAPEARSIVLPASKGGYSLVISIKPV